MTLSQPFHDIELPQYFLKNTGITPDQLQVARNISNREGKQFWQSLVSLGFLKNTKALEIIAQHKGCAWVDLNSYVIDPKTSNRLSKNFCKKAKVLLFDEGFEHEKHTFSLACEDPFDLRIQDHVTRLLKEQLTQSDIHLQPFLCDEVSIIEAIDLHFEDEKYLDNHKSHSVNEVDIIRLVQEILIEAVEKGISDIHISPEDGFIQIRLRRDGLLIPFQTFDQHISVNIINRLKILSHLDIAENRRPQSGSFQLNIKGRKIDFRLSCHPTQFGENIVARILDKKTHSLKIEDLGFDEDLISSLQKAISQPQGLIVITGPTGSGKTTTLYSLLSSMDVKSRNIMTLEDPIEYPLQGICQTQVGDASILSYADGVRSLLRQDPDVIFIAEIRDEETAHMALRAAMTGHLVITTLHTHDSFSVPGRLKLFGLQPESLCGHLLGILSQRLIRKICKRCKNHGCENCDHTGYRGRTVLCEWLECQENIWSILENGAQYTKLKSSAIAAGMKTLKDNARDKVSKNITTDHEIQRVLGWSLD